jgi:catechol 2,3-dioxygenase-like lactoylglutathione lyase family enzyme
MADSVKPRLVGMNHVALEVGDLDEALAFYGAVFDLNLRGRLPRMAFVDMGDQFIALAEGRTQGPDEKRHFGLVVDDRDAALELALAAGARHLGGHDIADPWGNFIQLVEYRDVQFTKAPRVLRGMGLEGLEKSAAALAELRDKGLD